MSSKSYASPLRLELRHSYRLRWLFLLFLALCQVSLSFTALALPVKLAVGLLLLWLALRCWVRRAELGGESLSLVWQEQGGWLWCQGESELKLILHGHTLVTPSLVLLCLQPHEGRGLRYALLFAAEHDVELFRRLRVRLLLERAEAC